MANRNGRLGSQWETDCVRFLAAHGFELAERRVREGINDRGDIAGVPGCVFECKNVGRLTLAQIVDEAERERQNAGAALGISLVKRRGRGVGDGYFVVPIRTGVTLIGGN